MESFSPYLDRIYDPLKAGSIDSTDDVPHDRAIARAMVAKYKPNKRVQGDSKLTLFVARLSPKTNEATLYNAFRQFGKIQQLRLVRDIVTGFSKCYGFVEFDCEKSLIHAYNEGKNVTIDDKEILVDYEHERTLKNWIPRRLGGGFGGRKESGQLRFGGRDRPFRRPLVAAPLKRREDSEDNLSRATLRKPKNFERNYKDDRVRDKDLDRSRRIKSDRRRDDCGRHSHSRTPDYSSRESYSRR